MGEHPSAQNGGYVPIRHDLQHPPLGGYVCSPFRTIFKPPLEVVVLTKTFIKILDELGYDVELTYKKKAEE